ncbi:MAG TPA: GNAT family protein [Rubrobacteraceae bacterium]|nr:GNAT family protein [Rubrobacteraceae bacterium]
MTAYVFRPMNDEEAREISGWSYDPPYDFYDATSDPGDLAELLDRKRRQEGAYYAAFDERGALVGFFQFEKKGRIVEVGLGLRPDLTGRKLGLGFMLAGLEFARRHFSPTGFQLSVATFNERAILVYERAGFRRGEVFMHHTNGGDHPFLLMTREA